MSDFLILILSIIIIPAIFHFDKSSKKIGFWLCFLIFAFLSAFRGSTIGNDTHEYLRIFNEINNGTFDDTETRYEKGYLLLNHTLHKLFSYSIVYSYIIVLAVLY